MPSQGAEDAKLDRLFRLIGTTNRVAVEFGARDGVSLSNTHRLRQLGWTCYLWDVAPASRIVAKEHLTRENVNAVFTKHQVPASIDLLSIDIDGNDYWVWQALTVCVPRVVVVEYNAAFGPGEAVVMPYRADHVWDKTTYFGASAAALAKLGRIKGYSLVDVERDTNLFFVRDEALLPPAAPGRYPATTRRWEAV